MNTIHGVAQDWYLPKHLGRVSQTRTFDSPLLIFKLEDASFGIDVQKGIIELLPYLHQEFGVRLVCVEGAAGDFQNLAEIRKNLDTAKVEQLKRELSEMHITGAEFVMLTTDLPLTLYGVENADQYQKHRQALAQTHYGHKTTLLIRKLKQLVTALKQSVYTPELFAFDQAAAQFEKGELKLHEFVQVLVGYALEGRIQLDHFPSLMSLIQSFALEAEIDWSTIERERSRFIQDLLDVLFASTVPISLLRRVVKTRYESVEHCTPLDLKEDYRQVVADIQKELINLALLFRVDRVEDCALYDLMVDLSSLCNLDISQYPALLSYVHYLHQTQRIVNQPFTLLVDVQQAIRQIQEQLFDNDKERALAKTSRMLDGLQKLCSLEMSPDLFDHFNRDFGRLTFATLLEDNFIQQVLLPQERAVLATATQNLLTTLEDDEEEKIPALFDLLGTLKTNIQGDSESELKDLEQNVENLTFTELLTDTDDVSGRIAMANFFILVLKAAKLATENRTSDGEEDAVQAAELMNFAEILRSYKDFPLLQDPLVRGLLRAELAVEGAYRFSQLATARGRSLVENMLRYMQEQGETTAILITGGFLTSKILPVLEREMISYQVITPSNQPSTFTAKDYVEQMARGSTQSEFMRELLASSNASS